MSYFILFFQSNFLEMPVYLPFLHRKNKNAFSSFALTTCVNAVTHPVVFLFFMNLKMSYLFNILAAEFFAIVTESFMVKKITGDEYWKCLLVSLIANLLSWQISPMITYALA